MIEKLTNGSSNVLVTNLIFSRKISLYIRYIQVMDECFRTITRHYEYFLKNTNNELRPKLVRESQKGLFSFQVRRLTNMIKRQYIDINEVVQSYLPMSKKKARKFVIRYLDHKRIGNKIYVDRIKLEELLKREDVESFPLD